MTTTPCLTCNRQDAATAGECRPCHAVSLAVCRIRNDWQPAEFAGLCDMLRAESLAQFAELSRQREAHTCRRLGVLLLRLLHVSGCDDATYRRLLVSRLEHDAGEHKAIAAMDGGIDAWNQRVAAHLRSVGQAIAKSAAKAKS